MVFLTVMVCVFFLTVMEINPQRSDLCAITDVVFFWRNRLGRGIFFVSPHNRPLNDDDPSHHKTDTTHHVTSRHIKSRHVPSHHHSSTLLEANTAHCPFQHRCRPTSFEVARGLHRNTKTNVSCMMRTCSPYRDWAKVHARWPSGQVGAVCTERPNWTSTYSHRH